jgi:hypothetical protein
MCGRHGTMKIAFPFILSATLFALACLGQNHSSNSDAGKVTLHSEGLHGYIGFGHEKLPREGNFTAGMGFYAAVWPLVDRPLAVLGA